MPPPDSETTNARARITRVRIKNYRSIGGCDVELGSLTFLVGPNGSGKSNFLDALRFVADSLRTTPEHALRDRGGVNEVRRRSSGHPTNFGIRLDLTLSGGASGYYSFLIGSKQGGGFEIQREQCTVRPAGTTSFEVKSGALQAS